MSQPTPPPTPPAPAPVKNPAKKRSFLQWIIYLILLLLLAWGIWNWMNYAKTHISTNDANVDAFHVEVSSDLLLRLMQMEVDIGDYVEQGQLLCQLDTRVLFPQQQAALAELEQANAQLDLAYVLRARTYDDYERGVRGFNFKIVSVQDFDHLQKAYAAAEQEVNVALKRIQAAKEQLNVMNAYLEKARIFAPMNGTIARRWSMEGDVLSPGQPIYSLYAMENPWVTAFLQEADIARVQLGDRVDIHVDAFPDRKFFGHVLIIGPAAAGQFSLVPPNNATGNYTKVAQRIPLRISIAPEDAGKQPHLRAGMSCEITIQTER